MMQGPGEGLARHELQRTLRGALTAAGLFSLAFNLLLLVSPLYMLQVYDRVLTSGSIDTLLLLSALAVGLLAVFAAADSGRRRVFALIGRAISDRLESPLFAAGMRAEGSGRKLESAAADLAKVQGLFANSIIQPVFDAPFVPMFVLLVFLVHPLLGAITLAGAVVLVLLAIAAERAAKVPVEHAGAQDRSAAAFLSGVSRHYAAIRAMGMGGAVEQRWRGLRAAGAEAALEANQVANGYGGFSRSIRQMLQVVTLGVAAWLVLRQEISAGAIIASSILAGRALAPIDQAIGAWKPFVQARRAWRNLEAFLPEPSAWTPKAAVPLPRPEATLVLRDLVVGRPGGGPPLLGPVSLKLGPGSVLLVVGASGQGKTSLLQVLSAASSPAGGSVAFGGRDLHGWDAADRGRHVGYLPQDVELLPGTVAENVARLQTVEPEAVIAAAQRAGCHAALLALKDGYDTPAGGDAGLSAGQRQDVGLARAVFGDPVLLLLDEPTAHLDARGVTALLELLASWRDGGRLAVVASHDRRLLNAATLVLDLRDGRATLAERDPYIRALAAAIPSARVHEAS